MNTSELSDDELAKVIDWQIQRIEALGQQEHRIAAAYFKSLGIEANCHVGTGKSLTRRETLEWFAGQVMDAMERGDVLALGQMFQSRQRFTGVVEGGIQ